MENDGEKERIQRSAAPEAGPGGGGEVEGAKELTAGGREAALLEKVQTQLEDKTREAAELFDKWLRLQAEVENFKKRMAREKSELMRFGNESLLREILPTLDNLERAIRHGREAKEISALLEGVEITQQELLRALEKFGVKPISALGEVFDPQKHEAISQVESDQEPNRVIAEEQKGYSYHERLLRPARVIVSKGRGDGAEGP